MRQAEVDSSKQGDRLTTEERERLDELENRELRRANEILKAASAYFAQALDPTRPSAMSFIDEHRSRFGVEPICRTLEWNVSSYYARKTRPPSRRELEDARLLGEIRRVHKHNYEAYGARRVWKQLAREGIELGRCRVERLMHAHGIAAPSARGPGDR